jgi:hypothetical protein
MLDEPKELDLPENDERDDEAGNYREDELDEGPPEESEGEDNEAADSEVKIEEFGVVDTNVEPLDESAVCDTCETTGSDDKLRKRADFGEVTRFSASKCHSILDELFDESISEPFKEPVDSVMFPDYLE